jgi:hypothetical protein
VVATVANTTWLDIFAEVQVVLTIMWLIIAEITWQICVTKSLFAINTNDASHA